MTQKTRRAVLRSFDIEKCEPERSVIYLPHLEFHDFPDQLLAWSMPVTPLFIP